MAMSYKRNRVQAKSLASRLAGFSIMGFGMSWKAPEPERVVVRDVITVLEDKRALYTGAAWEEPDHVVQSVLGIRTELTNGLKRVGDDSPAQDAFRIMRAACRDFLTETSQMQLRRHLDENRIWEAEKFFTALGTLRAIFGQQLATLGFLYGVDIEEPLSSILPPVSDKSES
jgi:hypothetical protein